KAPQGEKTVAPKGPSDTQPIRKSQLPGSHPGTRSPSWRSTSARATRRYAWPGALLAGVLLAVVGGALLTAWWHGWLAPAPVSPPTLVAEQTARNTPRQASPKTTRNTAREAKETARLPREPVAVAKNEQAILEAGLEH